MSDIHGLEEKLKFDVQINKKFLKINKKLISVVNLESLKIGNISRHLHTLNSAVLSLTDDFKGLTKTQSIQGFYLVEQMLTIMADRFTQKIKDLLRELGSALDHFLGQISNINSGKLPPSLIGPNELRQLIDSARTELPAHLRLVNFKTASDVLLLYKILKTEIIQSAKHFFFAIHVPLIDEKNRLEIFSVSTIPIPLSDNSNITVELDLPKSSILGIAADKKATVIFPENLLKKCTNFREFHFCSLQIPFEKNTKFSKCVLELKTQESIFKSCDQKLGYTTEALRK